MRKERYSDALRIGRSESWSVGVGIRSRTLLLELKSNWKCAGDDSNNSAVYTLKIFHITENLDAHLVLNKGQQRKEPAYKSFDSTDGLGTTGNRKL